ncbi:glycosyltransferase [Phormidesmis sp. 146-35]
MQQSLESRRFQKRIQQGLNLLCLLLLSALGLCGLYLLRDPDRIQQAGFWAVVSAGTLGTWRWSWFGLQAIRSRLYVYWVFPQWRKRANRMDQQEVPSVGIVVPTFREEPWITERVFGAIAREAQTLSKPLTLVAVTTAEEMIAIAEILRSIDPDMRMIHYVPLLDPARGKRGALAIGLRTLAQQSSRPDIVVLMDGDAIISEGAVRKCLPFFKLFPKLGGLTTDEKATVDGSKVFGEWLDLRFAQRHLYMCSHSLSRKILCLTGRYSLYRAEAALDPSFADLLENDTLQDWLWGEFKFLSGDDKSTWYWLLRAGYDMIYVPDVMVETLETVTGNVPMRMYQNMRRWFGNMLRNGSRAMALGPARVGAYTWYCLLDQRISFWTALVAPTLMLIYLIQGNWTGLSLIVSWILFTRPLRLLVYQWQREAMLKPIHVMHELLSQWSSSLVKIYTQMNLAQQKWSNRGNQSRSVAGTGLKRWMKLGTSRFLLAAQGFTFVIALLCLVGYLSPQVDIQAWWWRQHHRTVEQPIQILQATDYGVISNDDLDDAPALQKLFDRLPSQGRIQINLPSGELTLSQPLALHRSQTALKGQGQSRSILHLVAGEPGAIVMISPPNKAQPLKDIKLSHLTLLKDSTEDAFLMVKRANQTWFSNLQFQGSGTHALILQEVKDTHLEYLAFDGSFTQTPIAWRNVTPAEAPIVSSSSIP